MAAKVDKDGISLLPKSVGPGDCWFYEGKKGLTVAYTAEGTPERSLGLSKYRGANSTRPSGATRPIKRRKNAAKVKRAAK